ncbi:MAG: hypothetical protein CSA72_09955 [Rhodobacterales bacterium]|nr:MAG: hypothetical protein CSA72_09955 [Rhodobacterales bacterium]
MKFPRLDDGEGWAWGLRGDAPVEIWERFSPAYEAQAEAVCDAVRAMGLTPMIGGGGSEDGEYVMGTDETGVAQFLIHLEEPQAAEAIAQAKAEGRLHAYLEASR